MKLVTLILATLSMSISASSMGQDPLVAAGHVYKKKLENEKVRVMEVTFKPGQSIPWHSHPDHMAYALTGGTLTIYRSTGQSQTAKLKAGDVLWIPAEKHRAKNGGKTTLRVLVVEVK
jgi:quercetin dioxygenase-like cupin family protein